MIDLHYVLTILNAATKDAKRLDGKQYADDNRKSADAAAISRDLNHLADSLELAAGLIRNELWVAKGFAHPFEEDVQ